MVIAIDLDGVVFGTEEFFRTYSHLYDLYIVKNGLKDKKEMHVHKRYGWEQKDADNFYEKYTALVLENAPIKPGAKFVINELKQMGHKVICITLRGYYRECEKDITEKRLKESGIIFDKIYYNQKDKLEICKKEKVDLIIEDNPDNIRTLAENNIKCLHLKGAGLREFKHENVKEVQNWGEILEKILSFVDFFNLLC